ncbi:MAG: transposase, partial [Candidatus Hydrogenedentes bacterium]|nr:transposase [Candidatus Hydrogenedentota bacterium]
IYRTRENRNYCKERRIRLSGPPLGRPKKRTDTNAADLKKEKQIQYQDELDRNAIEGKFGQGKRRFTLGLIMAKLARTSEAVISISFIVMNLEKILSLLFCFLAYHYQTYCQGQRGNAPGATGSWFRGDRAARDSIALASPGNHRGAGARRGLAAQQQSGVGGIPGPRWYHHRRYGLHRRPCQGDFVATGIGSDPPS